MSKHVNKVARQLNELKVSMNPSFGANSDNEEDVLNRPIKTEDNKVTEQQLEQMEEKLEAAQADQKNLFLIIFQVIREFFI